MKIAIGSDHGGFKYKESIRKHLTDRGFEMTDFGTYSEESTDYNDPAVKVAQGVRDGAFDRGILICGTGVGMSIMANKVDGVRAALVHDLFTAEETRLHNDSNVLTMGQRVIDEDLALKITDIWVDTAFSNEDRHQRRVGKIDRYKGE